MSSGVCEERVLSAGGDPESSPSGEVPVTPFGSDGQVYYILTNSSMLLETMQVDTSSGIVGSDSSEAEEGTEICLKNQSYITLTMSFTDEDETDVSDIVVQRG